MVKIVYYNAIIALTVILLSSDAHAQKEYRAIICNNSSANLKITSLIKSGFGLITGKWIQEVHPVLLNGKCMTLPVGIRGEAGGSGYINIATAEEASSLKMREVLNKLGYNGYQPLMFERDKKFEDKNAVGIQFGTDFRRCIYWRQGREEFSGLPGKNSCSPGSGKTNLIGWWRFWKGSDGGFVVNVQGRGSLNIRRTFDE